VANGIANINIGFGFCQELSSRNNRCTNKIAWSSQLTVGFWWIKHSWL